MLSWLHYGVLKYRGVTIIQILVIIIAINSIHISLLAHKVTHIAFLQYRLSTWIKDYETIKSAEDMFGGINMILLLICFVLFMTVKPKRSLQKGE
jgi:hypothetical protein